MDGFAVYLALGVLVAKLVDTLRNLIDPGEAKPSVFWNLAALVFSLAICIVWQLDATNLIAGLNAPAYGPIPGEILTGLIVAGAAGGSHQVLDYISSSSNAKKKR